MATADPDAPKAKAAEVQSQFEIRPSLLDEMADGREYASIVGVMPPAELNLIDELKRAVREIETVRGRPCLFYVGNVIQGKADSGVITKDDLPFAEMVQALLRLGPEPRAKMLQSRRGAPRAHAMRRRWRSSTTPQRSATSVC